MNGKLSIIKYYPDNNRDEGFGIGLVLISSEFKSSLVKISSDRLKRINSSFGIKKSPLLELSLEEISNKDFDIGQLEYLSVYENGNIRFSKPWTIESENLVVRFSDLYLKYVADYRETGFEGKIISPKISLGKLSQSLQKQFRKNTALNNNLNIGYDFKENSIGKFLIGNTYIDFIGGNGTVFAGDIINLNLNSESISKNLFKTIALYEALEKTLPPGKFSSQDCKLLVLESQANDPLKADYMEKLTTWHKKAGYDLVIKKSLDDFEKDIEEKVINKKIIKFDEWIENIPS